MALLHLSAGSSSTWLVFVVASLALAATPGPGVVYIVTRTLSQGRAAGLASVAGVALGNLGNALAASLGLAALLSVSALAFEIVKFAGAAYLIVLGVKALIGRRTTPGGGVEAASPAKVLRQGFTVALLNPKTALFFGAFLPPFIDTALAATPQTVLHGGVFVAIAAATDTAWALAANRMAPLLARPEGAASWGRYLTAAVYVGLGLFTAAWGERGR